MTGTLDASRWLVNYHRKPNAKHRLLCFSHAGGSASTFSTWHRQLPDELELWAVQLPGREVRRNEPPALNIDLLLEQFCSVLTGFDDRPYTLLGYSLGALLAFEYARTLRRSGRPAPAQLVVAAARAPHVPFDKPFHNLPEPEFLREVQTRYDSIPGVIRADPEMLAYFLPVLRADLQLRSSYCYRAEEPLDCPITALTGADDALVRVADLEKWRTHTTGSFASHVFPGGHFFIQTSREAALRVVAQCCRS